MAVILVVDDEKKINDLISMNLEMVGHRAIQAFTSKEALEWNQRAELDLVLLDIMLPELDGYELLPYFMKKQVPVIYLTAKDSLMDKVKGLKLGADDYVTKPFESIELLARVEAGEGILPGRGDGKFCPEKGVQGSKSGGVDRPGICAVGGVDSKLQPGIVEGAASVTGLGICL